MVSATSVYIASTTVFHTCCIYLKSKDGILYIVFLGEVPFTPHPEGRILILLLLSSKIQKTGLLVLFFGLKKNIRIKGGIFID